MKVINKSKLIILFAMLFSGIMMAQTAYLSVCNYQMTSPTSFRYSVYLKNTSQVQFAYGSGSYGFDFNKAILGTGTMTGTIISSGLPAAYAPNNPTVKITTTPGHLVFTAKAPVDGGPFINAGDSVEIFTAVFTNSAPFTTDPVNLAFRTASPDRTLLYRYTTGNTGTMAALTPSNYYIYPSGTTPTISWQNTINLIDAGSGSGAVVFGQAPTATNGIDAALGEAAISGSPVAGVFDARFILPVTPTVSSLKDFRADSVQTVEYVINFQPGTAGYPVTLKWQRNAFPTVGFFRLTDMNGNTLANMKTDSMFVAQSASNGALKIVYTKVFCSNVAVTSNWNIIAVPVTPASLTGSVLFPMVNSPFFGFNAASGYASVTDLTIGKGYWARFDSNRVVTVCGAPVGLSNIPVTSGWNLIGLYDADIATSAVSTTPAGIINSSFFGFTYPSGYSSPTTLKHGTGYWVRVSQNGLINLSSAPGKVQETFEAKINPEWTALSILDNTGFEKTLYLSKNNESLSAFDLPPVPPTGISDIRFSTGRFVEKLSAEQDITLQSLNFPVFVTAKGSDLLIQDKATNGKLVKQTLRNGQQIVITNAAASTLQVLEAKGPTEFALSQNYPNPFNPSTKIDYQLPVDAIVTMEIYSVTGEKVVTLMNEEPVTAGYYSIDFQASKYKLGSGVYIYRFTAKSKIDKSFTSANKMIIIK